MPEQVKDLEQLVAIGDVPAIIKDLKQTKDQDNIRGAFIYFLMNEQDTKADQIFPLITDKIFTENWDYEFFAQLNFKDTNPLHIMSSLGQTGNTYLKEVQYLLSKGANPNFLSGNGNAPIHEIVNKPKFTPIIKLLLQNKADIDLQNEDGSTATLLTVKKNNPSMLTFLLNMGADVNAYWDNAKLQNLPDYGTLLTYTAMIDNATIAKSLVDVNSAQDLPDAEGYFALHYAVMNENEELVDFLVRKFKTIDCVENNKNTPLHLAGFYKLESIFKRLLELGANPNLKNKKGELAGELMNKQKIKWVETKTNLNEHKIYRYICENQDQPKPWAILDRGTDPHERDAHFITVKYPAGAVYTYKIPEGYYSTTIRNFIYAIQKQKNVKAKAKMYSNLAELIKKGAKGFTKDEKKFQEEIKFSMPENVNAVKKQLKAYVIKALTSPKNVEHITDPSFDYIAINDKYLDKHQDSIAETTTDDDQSVPIRVFKFTFDNYGEDFLVKNFDVIVDWIETIKNLHDGGLVEVMAEVAEERKKMFPKQARETIEKIFWDLIGQGDDFKGAMSAVNDFVNSTPIQGVDLEKDVAGYKKLILSLPKNQAEVDAEGSLKYDNDHMRYREAKSYDRVIDKTAESTELYSYIVSSKLFDTFTTEICGNFDRKKKKNEYNPALAMKGVMNFVKKCARLYCTENCSTGDKVSDIFSVEDLEQVATSLLKKYETGDFSADYSEDRAEIVAYTKLLKQKLSKDFGFSVRTTVVKQVGDNPWIQVWFHSDEGHIIPNEFRKKCAEVVYGKDSQIVHDWNNVELGNIRPFSISMHYKEWLQVWNPNPTDKVEPKMESLTHRMRNKTRTKFLIDRVKELKVKIDSGEIKPDTGGYSEYLDKVKEMEKRGLKLESEDFGVPLTGHTEFPGRKEDETEPTKPEPAKKPAGPKIVWWVCPSCGRSRKDYINAGPGCGNPDHSPCDMVMWDESKTESTTTTKDYVDKIEAFINFPWQEDTEIEFVELIKQNLDGIKTSSNFVSKRYLLELYKVNQHALIRGCSEDFIAEFNTLV